MHASRLCRSRPAWMPRTALRLAPPTTIYSRQQVRTIRSIQQPAPRVSRFNAAFKPLKASPAAAIERRIASDTIPWRTGALAVKKGMSSLYDPTTGERTPCTVLQMERVQVVAHKTRERNGYFAVCVGQGWRLPKNVGNAMLGVYAGALHEAPDGDMVGIAPKKDIREFQVRDASGLLDIGSVIQPSWFQVGQFIDARAPTRGFGFTGGMKKWGWHGQDRSHGVSLAHRSMGSSGGGQGSGSRVHPGKKMAGRMGGQRHTTQNLKVLQVDDANGIVIVHGGVSGPKGCLVQIQDALKKPWPDMPAEPPSAQAAAEPMREAAQ